MTTKEELDRIAQTVSEAAGDHRYTTDYYLLRYGFRMMLPRLKGPRVLELGCASGGVTRLLAGQFADLTVVDGSAALLEEAKRNVGRDGIEWHCALFEEFQPREKFDAIVMAHVLEHLDDPVSILRRAGGWLAPGGSIHAIVPNAGSLNRRVGRAMGMLSKLDELHAGDHRVGHQRVYFWHTLRADVEKAGLTVEHMDGVLLKPLSDSQVQGWDPKILDALFEVGLDLPHWCSEIYVQAGAPKL